MLRGTHRRSAGRWLWPLPFGLVTLAAILTLALASAAATISEDAKLVASDAGGNDTFGYAVDIDGDLAVIGAQGTDDQGSSSGSAYVFQRTNGVWSEVDELLAGDGAMFDNFGQAVAISGQTIIVGSPQDGDNGAVSGSAYIFTETNGTWTQQAKLLASDGGGNDTFGYAVDIDGDLAVIGAQGTDDQGSSSGSAYVFQRTNG
ncbi:MAG: FG-GAP repeat protein, partial [Actinomycetota bacterium]